MAGWNQPGYIGRAARLAMARDRAGSEAPEPIKIPKRVGECFCGQVVAEYADGRVLNWITDALIGGRTPHSCKAQKKLTPAPPAPARPRDPPIAPPAPRPESASATSRGVIALDD